MKKIEPKVDNVIGSFLFASVFSFLLGVLAGSMCHNLFLHPDEEIFSVDAYNASTSSNSSTGECEAWCR